MTYKELNDESVKLLYEFTPLFSRLKDAVTNNRDPFSIITAINNKIQFIDENLLSILAKRDRVFLQEYLKEILKEENICANIVLPKAGVPVKLISSFAEILIAIFRKYPDKTFMVNIESYENGCAIYSILRDIKFDEIQGSSVVKAISTLDGVLAKVDETNSKIILPNIFGREKFIKIFSKNGCVALPYVSIINHQDTKFNNYINKKLNIEIALGADRMKFNVEVAGVEISLRTYPKNPIKTNYFKGVILGSDGLPVPVLNVSELFNEGVFEWLY